ncbi:conserved Plasmodium protein, unknown function [Babesia microti strain RI]|uniref:Uncharacterized protein n=1 Tax=Babesia microti (strain RI) TaxID=1133968 RepID=A0A1R4AA28_BABMR|nr:conserved Plasmodium protein, unknown function [Babesia microti strain RI]SJK85849.1 conserved Plasmodium protein, unknown function [Babesia microti strain RI]|eukprot:XP_021338063.1 conserved Plasmodium protein, unknown function [Babesia microti strain RI]
MAPPALFPKITATNVMSKSRYYWYTSFCNISILSKPSSDSQSCIPLKITPKYHQKPLGSYPIPPEQEMLWKNRRKCYGGFYQQSISPFQLKIFYPLIHQFPARFWAKLSQGWWWVYWPALMTLFVLYKINYENDRFIRRHFFD